MSSDEQLDELLDRYRYSEVEDTWWSECIINQFLEDQEKANIWIDKKSITWEVGVRGGCATFVAAPYSFERYFNDHWDKEDYPWVRRLLDACGEFDVDASLTRYSRDACPESLSVVIDNPSLEDYIDMEDPLVEMCFDEWQREYELELERIEDEIKDHMIDLMHELHKQLEGEYEYLLSDQAVYDFLEAHELLPEQQEDAA